MRFPYSVCVAVALAAAIAADRASATTVVAYLTQNTPTTWTLALDDTLNPFADNGGIASYGFVLNGALTVAHVSPRDGFAQGPTGVGPAGFTVLRSADNVTTLLASQDTTTPTPNLIYNFGREASSFAAKGINDFTGGTQVTSPTWDARLVVATGTNAPGVPVGIDGSAADSFVNVFVSGSIAATKSASLPGNFLVDPTASDFD